MNIKTNQISAAHRMKFWIFSKLKHRHLDDDIYQFDGGNTACTAGPRNTYRVPRNLKAGDILIIMFNTKDGTMGFIKNEEALKMIWRNLRVHLKHTR